MLAGVDEFHLGGRLATQALLDDLELPFGASVLDAGCGIGGAARAMASLAGCHVTGVDLSPVFVATAAALSDAVVDDPGRRARLDFRVGSVLDLPFDDASFDAVTMLHVGMNIADKPALVAELARVLRPGGRLAVYDIMRIGHGDLGYPMPWAPDARHSHVASPEVYLDALVAAGMVPTSPVDRRPLVRSALAAAAAAPPPIGLGDLMGPAWPTMFGNLRTALEDGVLAPIQILARHAA